MVVGVSVSLEAKLGTMRDCLLNLRRDYDRLLNERTEYQVTWTINHPEYQLISISHITRPPGMQASILGARPNQDKLGVGGLRQEGHPALGW